MAFRDTEKENREVIALVALHAIVSAPDTSNVGFKEFGAHAFEIADGFIAASKVPAK